MCPDKNTRSQCFYHEFRSRSRCTALNRFKLIKGINTGLNTHNVFLLNKLFYVHTTADSSQSLQWHLEHRPVGLIPPCISPISHNAPFCSKYVHTCTKWCIVGYSSSALWNSRGGCIAISPSNNEVTLTLSSRKTMRNKSQQNKQHSVNSTWWPNTIMDTTICLHHA